jgi:probable rRNA maturation factor
MIVNRQRRIPVDLEPLAEFCRRVREELHFPEDGVTVRLVSDPAIARLNRIFRGKNAPTDVLSFPSTARPAQTAERQVRAAARPARTAARNGSSRRGTNGAGNLWRRDAAISPAYVGDIAISLETARRNARRASRRFPLELRILILHGMLHLAGYDHENDQGQMEQLERRLRRRFGLHD